jgi:hypothetical protein
MDTITQNNLRSQYQARLDAALLEIEEAARLVATECDAPAYLHDLARAILGALASKATIRHGLLDAAQRARRARDGRAGQ